MNQHEYFSYRVYKHELLDYLLEMDEFLLVAGPKTVFQETLIQVFSDFAELRLMVEDSAPATASVTPAKVKAPWPTGATLGKSSHQSTINVNTASAQQLTLLPHISPQRAAEIIQLRPIRQLSELKKVRGIGPARLRDIELFGVCL